MTGNFADSSNSVLLHLTILEKETMGHFITTPEGAEAAALIIAAKYDDHEQAQALICLLASIIDHQEPERSKLVLAAMHAAVPYTKEYQELFQSYFIAATERGIGVQSN